MSRTELRYHTLNFLIVIKETPGSAGGLPGFDSSKSRFDSLHVDCSKYARKETENRTSLAIPPK